MVLTCPTAKEVPRYSFSNSPYKRQKQVNASINTHLGLYQQKKTQLGKKKKIGPYAKFRSQLYCPILLVLEVKSQQKIRNKHTSHRLFGIQTSIYYYLNRVCMKGYVGHWVHPKWSWQSISNPKIARRKHHDHLKWYPHAPVVSSGNA